jgi:hypothetical protein
MTIEDTDERRADGPDINKYALGTSGTNKGQPCAYRYKRSNFCLTLSEPLWVHLPHVSEDKENAVLVLQESHAQSSYTQIRRRPPSLNIRLVETTRPLVSDTLREGGDVLTWQIRGVWLVLRTLEAGYTFHIRPTQRLTIHGV